LLFLGNLGIVEDVGLYWSYWPVFLIALGLVWLVRGFSETSAGPLWGSVITGAIALLLGVAYLGQNLDLYDFQIGHIWGLFWPVVLILIGYTLLRGRASSSGGRTAFMGGIEMGGTRNWILEGGSYLAVMGSIEMDLRTAEISEGETLLDLTAVMGSVEIEVPADVTVIYDGSTVLGGISFLGEEDGGVVASRRTERPGGDGSKVLRIQARSIMGSVEIKEA
ncbi:MAG: LiaF-related protein, partial [Bacillota bacterium]